MKKAGIKTRYEHGGRVPSINVKIGYRKFAPGLTPDGLNCDEETFNTAIDFAFTSAQERFWEEAQDIAEHHLGKRGSFKRNVTVYSAGRSSGHLIVDGLDPVETWDAIMVSAWGRFVRAIETEMEYLCAVDYVKEDIEANRWNEPGAEFVNLIHTKDRHETSLSEMKKQAIAAGFGPVVRL